MTIVPSYPPHDMYHGSEWPKSVTSAAERADLEAAGWTMTYQHQPFPSVRYRKTGKDKDGAVTFESKTVANQDEADALGKGWQDLPPTA